LSDRHSESVPAPAIKIWRSLLSIILLVLTALILIPFRKLIGRLVLNIAAYIVYSVDLIGKVIPQQVLWLLLIILILYIAVGSFYGKISQPGSKRVDASPVIGPVEARMRWIEEKKRGIYFKWQMANLLGNVYQSIQNLSSNETTAPSQEVQDFFDAGLNTTYADYPVPGLFEKKPPTPFDIPLERVVEFIEEQMEIRDAQ
jgi:hypothetical protein